MRTKGDEDRKRAQTGPHSAGAETVRLETAHVGEDDDSGNAGTTSPREVTVYVIYPCESPRSIYLHGSTLQMLPDGSMCFENELMPPGQPVMQWFSAGYPDRRDRQPQLPSLTEGADMHLHACLRAEPADGFLLEANFRDRYGQQVGELRFYPGEENFRVPPHTHSWRLQLVQTGGCALCLHHLELQTQADFEAWRAISGTLLHTNRVKTLNILLPDLSHRTNHLPGASSLRRLDNLFCLPLASATVGEDGGWCDLSAFNAIDWAYWNQAVLTGYGPASIRAARELKAVLEKWDISAKLRVSERSGLADLLRQTPETGGSR